MEFVHKPVMLEECLQALHIRPDGTYLDGTAGGAGHSKEIAKQLDLDGHLYALDQDPNAVKTATERLKGLPATVIRSNFRDVGTALAPFHIAGLDGALLDLGVSSHQLDDASRGFSYREDAPLDMRMSQEGFSAADILHSYSREQIADILRKYGEEPYAWQIAGKIVQTREEQPIRTTKQLADLIISSVPPAVRRKSKNPAKRSFQAIRIAVNGEMEALEEGIKAVFSMLNVGGRFAILTFHSLEDRMVKQAFKAYCTACTCPPEMPICVCGGQAKAVLIGKNPIIATQKELAENRRSHSAKLRVLEKK